MNFMILTGGAEAQAGGDTLDRFDNLMRQLHVNNATATPTDEKMGVLAGHIENEQGPLARGGNHADDSGLVK